jgi:hypothetical protein
MPARVIDGSYTLRLLDEGDLIFLEVQNASVINDLKGLDICHPVGMKYNFLMLIYPTASPLLNLT